MSITTKATLVDNIYKWLIRDQTTDSFVNEQLVETYIQLTESEFNRELKIFDLISTEAITLGTVNNYRDLPDGFRGIISFEFDDRPYDLEFFATRRAMKERYASNLGRPAAYTIIGNRIYFNCIPDQAYTMTMDYYEAVEPLSDSVTSNIILEKYPDAYLYGGIRQALINLNIKERLEDVAVVYKDIIDRIKEDDKNGRIPVGSAMKPRQAMGAK